ncbi:MAG: hypothetical protein D6726_05465 [Nitrospirae bacterium]|nr:MAG: hypothetical protein D6726_05465 [Nitrospirota bacterium]
MGTHVNTDKYRNGGYAQMNKNNFGKIPDTLVGGGRRDGALSPLLEAYEWCQTDSISVPCMVSGSQEMPFYKAV